MNDNSFLCPMQLLTLFIYITAVLLSLYLLLINVYLYWFSRLRVFTAVSTTPVKGFTVIIPARNEEANIEACIRSVMRNHYPARLFEIIVADDFSTDATPQVVQQLQKEFSNLHLLSLKDCISETINSYKKRAIELAIAQSRFEWIVTTDADCAVPPNWLPLLDGYIQQQAPVFVAAPVMFNNNKTFPGIFQCLDFLSLQGITAAAVSAGTHSMCNGANLAYRKAAFYAVDGFKNADHIASGDDMLLMHKIQLQYRGKIGYLFSNKAIVTTAPMPDWRSFLNQRIRWASKATSYTDKRIFWVLMLVYFTNLFLLLLLIVCFFKPALWPVWLACILAKALLEMPFMYRVARFFSLTALMPWFVLMQPLHVVYTVVSGWLGKFGTYKWKGRKVR